MQPHSAVSFYHTATEYKAGRYLVIIWFISMPKGKFNKNYNISDKCVFTLL